jgi:hypothetical protein
MPRFPHAKLQGEWAEACFAAEALRRGFIVSKPLGDSAPYDFVLEWRRRAPHLSVTPSGVRARRTQSRGNAFTFVSLNGTAPQSAKRALLTRNKKLKTKNSRLSRIQVKSVSVRNPPAGIYHVATMRSVATAKKAYCTGDFDFLAAFIIPRKIWYIIPAREIVGIKMISLCPGHRPSNPGAPFKPSFGLSGEVSEARAASKNPRPSASIRGERFFSKLETGNSKPSSSSRLTFRPRRLEKYRNAWRLLCA